MKQWILYIIMILSLGVYFSGQILTADAGPQALHLNSQSSLLVQQVICEPDTDSETGEIILAEGDGCPDNLSVEDGNDERVPTAVKLVYTGTEIRDPVSTAGIVFIFFVLVALTVLWIGVIRHWNRIPQNF